jgi:hypothetical protein
MCLGTSSTALVVSPVHVGVGTREALHESAQQRVVGGGHDDRNRAGRMQQRLGGEGGGRNDDIDVRARQLDRKLAQQVGLAVGMARLVDDVPALLVAEIAHRLRESLGAAPRR